MNFLILALLFDFYSKVLEKCINILQLIEEIPGEKIYFVKFEF